MYSLLSYNIDTNFGRVEDGPFRKAFSEWRIDQRMPYIIAFLKKMDSDIIHIQEGRQCTNSYGEMIDSVTPIKEALETDYEVITRKYYSSEKSFIYISAFKKSVFEFCDCVSYYLTDTPYFSNTEKQLKEYIETPSNELTFVREQWKETNGFEEFERSILLCHIRDRNTRHGIMTVNCHLGISAKHRIYASHKINKMVEEFKGYPIILSGDFNSLPEWQGQEQVKIINLQDATLNMELMSDYRISDSTEKLDHKSTFVFFPYDWKIGDEISTALKNKCDKMNNHISIRKLVWDNFQRLCDDSHYPMGGQLDYVFYHKCDINHTALIPVWIYKATEYRSDTLGNLIFSYEEPILASDHQAILVKFSI
jgi:hypothetical protein